MGMTAMAPSQYKATNGPRQMVQTPLNMDESWVSVVAEVERGKVEKVDDQDDLSPDVVAANKQHDKCELEEVVNYEMASNTSGCVDIIGVGGEKVPHIADLQK